MGGGECDKNKTIHPYNHNHFHKCSNSSIMAISMSNHHYYLCAFRHMRSSPTVKTPDHVVSGYNDECTRIINVIIINNSCKGDIPLTLAR